THWHRRCAEHDLPRAGVHDGESLGERAPLQLGDRESQGYARARAARAPAARRHARPHRPRRRGEAVRPESDRDRPAERQDCELHQEARVERRGRAGRGAAPGERPAARRRARRRDRAVPAAATAGVSRVAGAGILAGWTLVITLVGGTARAAETADVAWHPARPRVGDVAWLHVRNVPEAATVEGSVDGRSLTFFPYAGGQAALVGIDLEAKPGVRPWRIAVVERGREPRSSRPTRAARPSSASSSSPAAWSYSTTASAYTPSTSTSTRWRSARASASSAARRSGAWGPAVGRPGPTCTSGPRSAPRGWIRQPSWV